MNERELERSEERVAQERAAAIRRARSAVEADGAEDCIDCGRPIPPERREVAPFAERCVPCQQIAEKNGRLYAS